MALPLRRSLLGGGILAAGILASIVHHVVYLSREPVSTVNALLSLLAPLFALVAAVAVVGSIHRSEADDGYVFRVAVWYLCGATVLGLAGYTSLTYQLPDSTLSSIWLPVVNWVIGGSFIGLLVGYNDVRRRHAVVIAEERREVADRQTRRLSVLNRVLRHDTRNKLNVVLAHADMLAEETDSDSPAAIRRAGEDLYDLTERARVLQSLVDTPPQQIDPADEVREAVEWLRTKYPEVQITTDLTGDGEIRASPVLSDVLRDLLENAVVHNDRPPAEVEVAVKLRAADDEQVSLVVEDNGPGIPTGERVVLKDGGETQLAHSLGTGLWLTRWVVEESGGSLDIDERFDGGARVAMRFPRAA